METEVIQSFINDFESYSKQTDNGVEFWLARDLQKLLDYEQWRNFITVIEKAKITFKGAENAVSDRFAGVSKTIKMPKGAGCKIADHFAGFSKMVF